MPKRLGITNEGSVVVVDYEDPPLEPNQVLIKTELASGKHGTTTAMMDGRVFGGQDFPTFNEKRIFVSAKPLNKKPVKKKRGKPAPPPPPGGTGTAGVGVVQKTGKSVTRWKKGDRVFGHMDIRETNICTEDSLYLLGDLDPAVTLCTEPAYVSIHCIRESYLRWGDTVVIIGLGAIGLIAVEMARAAGAEKVFAVDMLPRRRKWAAANGADQVFDPSKGDVALQIHDATGGKGVDVAIETAGAYEALHTALRATRICGTVCAAGFYQGEARAIHLGREFHHNRLNLVAPHGCGWGHEPRDYPRWNKKRTTDSIISMMRQGKLKCPGLIYPIVPLGKGPEVWDHILNDPDKVIKYAIKFC